MDCCEFYNNIFSDYLIMNQEDEIKIRVKGRNNDSELQVSANEERARMIPYSLVAGQYIELQIEDFLYLINNGF